MMKQRLLLICLVMVCAMQYSCQSGRDDSIEILLSKWYGKEIYFPKDTEFTIYGDSIVDLNIEDAKYKIVHYVDSTGCTTCKIDFDKWKAFIGEFADNDSVRFVFYIHAKQKREVKIALKNTRFDYPVCLDYEDIFNKTNDLPLYDQFQTLLLDKDNKVVCVGNPVQNGNVKELYLNIINGMDSKQEIAQTKTKVKANSHTIDLGQFDWNIQKDTLIALKNIGPNSLQIYDVVSSCGCTVVDYNKNACVAGDSLSISVSYKAENPGFFNKSVIVYCNVEESPLSFRIKGNAIKTDDH